jgi:D-sedoheptulose 7-phosphate isomerase
MQHFQEAANLLQTFMADETAMAAVVQAGDAMASALRDGKKILTCGNGGSSCDAMHFAEELTGRYRDDRPALPAISITESGHITCVGNDYGYDKIFSRYVEAHGHAGDVLVAISTSGNSHNVIEAAKTARSKNMIVVGLTGKDGGALASLCHHEVRVPWQGYADRIQEIHIKVIHSWIDHIEQKLFHS